MPFYVGGTAGMRNRGDYVAGTTYFPNDMVQYQGSTYLATATTTGNLPTNTSFWGVFASGQSAGDPIVYTSGYYFSRKTSAAIPATGGNATPAFYPGSRVYFVPCYLFKAVSITTIGVVTSNSTAPTAGCVIRLGYYTMNATTGAPDALVSDFGTISPTAVATYSYVSVSTTLPKGWIWFALAFNNVDYGGLQGVAQTSAPYPVLGWPSNVTPANLNGGITPTPHYVNTANTTAAPLAATAGATVSVPSASTPTFDVFFRAA